MTTPRDPIEAPATEPGRNFLARAGLLHYEEDIEASDQIMAAVVATEAAARDEGRQEAVRLDPKILATAAENHTEEHRGIGGLHPEGCWQWIADEYERLARHGRSSDPTEDDDGR